MVNQDRFSVTLRVSLVAAVVNAALGTLKLVFGFLGNSQALVADGVHSFSDLITDGLVILAARIGSHGADDDHPYGHARIETAATVVLAGLLMFAAAAIIWDALLHVIVAEHELIPRAYVLWVAGVSVFANEWLYRYTLKAANRIKSNLLIANAWHSRSDAASSVIVFIGVAGSMMGWPLLDELAAILVGCFIIKMAWDLAASSVRELVDTGVDEVLYREIHDTITAIPGARTLHQLRTRSMGGKVLVDVHILVDPYISVSEGHHIGDQVQMALLNGIEAVNDVTVHIDPEDDQLISTQCELPTRSEIVKLLKERWEGLPGSENISRIILHYLSGKVRVDLILTNNGVWDEHVHISDLTKQYHMASADLDYIQSIHLYQQI